MMVRLVLPLWTPYMMNRARPESPMAPFLNPSVACSPGVISMRSARFLLPGSAIEMRSVGTFRPPSVLLKSTTGLAPLTVTVSSRPPTFNEALTRAAKPATSDRFSRTSG